MLSEHDLAKMVDGYCGEALYCLYMDDSDDTFADAGYTEADIADETRRTITEDCRLFVQKANDHGIIFNEDVLPYIDAYELGIQFYLSGQLVHGNNFSTCNDLPTSIADILHDVALEVGSECYAEVDNDNRVWLRAYGEEA